MVEGDSDELIIQKAYIDKHSGKLPIENSIDVICVRSLAFKRFLAIAKELKQPVAVVTDNDGKYDEKVTKKYEDYKDVGCIEIIADKRETLKTLEPQFADANKGNLPRLCKAIGIKYSKYNSVSKIVEYMASNKTKWALNVFDTTESVEFPKYINKAIEWCDEE